MIRKAKLNVDPDGLAVAAFDGKKESFPGLWNAIEMSINKLQSGALA